MSLVYEPYFGIFFFIIIFKRKVYSLTLHLVYVFVLIFFSSFIFLFIIFKQIFSNKRPFAVRFQ